MKDAIKILNLTNFDFVVKDSILVISYNLTKKIRFTSLSPIVFVIRMALNNLYLSPGTSL